MRPSYAYIGPALMLLLLIGASFFMRHTNTAPVTSSPQTIMDTLTLTSPAFSDGGEIPAEYTCDAAETAFNPPLEIGGVPSAARSLALIVDDHDVPKKLKPDGVFDHWVLFNIPPETRGIPERASIGVSGANGRGDTAYTGPCPPSAYEPKEHRYIFTLYALDTMLDLKPGATKQEVLDAMQRHVLKTAQLIGRYQRK